MLPNFSSGVIFKKKCPFSSQYHRNQPHLNKLNFVADVAPQLLGKNCIVLVMKDCTKISHRYYFKV